MTPMTVVASPGAIAQNLPVGPTTTGTLTIQTGGTLIVSGGAVGNLSGGAGHGDSDRRGLQLAE